MIDLFNFSNEELIHRLESINHIKGHCELGDVNVKVMNPHTHLGVMVTAEDIEPIIRLQLMLVKDELRRRFG